MLPQSEKLHGHETLSDVFKEMRADEAAGKREDAHWYGDEAVLENHNVTGFKAQAAQRGRQPGEGYPVIHYEEPDGSLHQWADLIDQLKEMLAYVAKLEAKEEEREHDKEALFNAGGDALDRKPLDGAKALKDILRGDYPKQKEAKTKDNGREI